MRRYPEAVDAFGKALQKLPGDKALIDEQAAARKAAGEGAFLRSDGTPRRCAECVRYTEPTSVRTPRKVSTTRTLHGFHAVTARLRQRPESVLALYVADTKHGPRMRELLARAAAARRAVHAADEPRLRDLAGTDRHQGVVAIVDAAAPEITLDEVIGSAREPLLLLVLDGVTDPHNLGACLRSADAFGAHAVIVPKDRAVGVNATVAKAASGAADNGARDHGDQSRVRAARRRAGRLDPRRGRGGQRTLRCRRGRTRWGGARGEGAGLRRLTRELCDRIVGIPLGGTVESLNVSVVTGICLFASRRARTTGQ